MMATMRISQCRSVDSFGKRCQGASRHDGEHWYFNLQGNYIAWQDNWRMELPPDYKHYQTPKQKAPEYYWNVRKASFKKGSK